MDPVERPTEVLHLLKAGPKTLKECAAALCVDSYRIQLSIRALQRGGYRIAEAKERGKDSVYTLVSVPALVFPEAKLSSSED